MAENKWAGAYAAWSECYDLPPTDPRVVRAVISEKLTQALDRLQFNKQSGYPRIDEG